MRPWSSPPKTEAEPLRCARRVRALGPGPSREPARSPPRHRTRSWEARARAGVRGRLVTLLIAAVISISMALAASKDFVNRFADLLAVLLYLFTPWTAINLVDFYWVRKCHYSVREIFNPHGMYGRWNWRGLTAYAVGFVSMIPFFSSPMYTGPIARALGRADIAMLVGLPARRSSLPTFSKRAPKALCGFSPSSWPGRSGRWQVRQSCNRLGRKGPKYSASDCLCAGRACKGEARASKIPAVRRMTRRYGRLTALPQIEQTTRGAWPYSTTLPTAGRSRKSLPPSFAARSWSTSVNQASNSSKAVCAIAR